MMHNRISQRVQLLFNSRRYKEAIEYLEVHLSEHSQDSFAQYCLAIAYFRSGNNTKSRQICEQLLIETPDSEVVISLSAEIDIEENRLQKAESKAEILISINPYNSDHHLLMGRVCLAQRAYDRALASLEKSLEIDPENLDALNCKIVIDGLLGNSSNNDTIDQALEIDPESPYTIANQSEQMLRDGKVQEALDRLHYALSLDPSNPIAQRVMVKAIKSKFWTYRLFSKYQEYMARLSAGGIWKVILGLYIGNQIIIKIANTNPELGVILYPISYFIVALFILSWVIEPLMNFYLLTNKYGRALLDADKKTMAKCTGIAFFGALAFMMTYMFSDNVVYLELSIMIALMMIPLGSFLHPKSDKNRKILSMYVIGLVVLLIFSFITSNLTLYYIFLAGIFAYQWIVNAMSIKEGSRVF